MVGRIDEDGVFSDADVIKRCHQTSQIFIQRGDVRVVTGDVLPRPRRVYRVRTQLDFRRRIHRFVAFGDMFVRVMRRPPTQIEAERLIGVFTAVLNGALRLKIGFIAFNLHPVPDAIVIRRVEIVVVAIPAEPFVKAEAHHRRDELVPRHTAEVPLADVAGRVAGSSEHFRDAGFRQR